MQPEKKQNPGSPLFSEMPTTETWDERSQMCVKLPEATRQLSTVRLPAGFFISAFCSGSVCVSYVFFRKYVRASEFLCKRSRRDPFLRYIRITVVTASPSVQQTQKRKSKADWWSAALTFDLRRSLYPDLWCHKDWFLTPWVGVKMTLRLRLELPCSRSQ